MRTDRCLTPVHEEGDADSVRALRITEEDELYNR
jgi:hypothetical protein